MTSYPQNPNAANWQSQKPSSSLDHDRTMQSHDNPDAASFKFVLNQDERRVMAECESEAFYYRSVPLSILCSGLAYIAIKNGYLKKNANFGYVPKMVFGSLIGFIGGRISYQRACMEKLLKLPNSPIADEIRKRKGLPSYHESFALEPKFEAAGSEELIREPALYEERQPDLSEHNEGMDSYDKVTESLSPYSGLEEGDKKSTQSYVSYEDLRRGNREEYINKLAEKYRRPTPVAPDSNNPQEPKPKSEPYFNSKRNKYGDIWEE